MSEIASWGWVADLVEAKFFVKADGDTVDVGDEVQGSLFRDIEIQQSPDRSGLELILDKGAEN